MIPIHIYLLHLYPMYIYTEKRINFLRNKTSFSPRQICECYGAVIYLRIITNIEIRTPIFKKWGRYKIGNQSPFVAANMGLWVLKALSYLSGSLTCLSQDTVVALHALSKYGAATFTSTEKAVQVTIRSSGTFSTNFQVDNNNRLLLQQISLPKVPGEYSMTATGEGCVYLQVRVFGQMGADGPQ